MSHFLKSLAAGLGILVFSQFGAAANPSIVIDAGTGQVVSAEDATRPWIPASTTKMMTVYVTLKAIREGRARLDSPLQVSALASRQRPVKMYLKPGQIITLDNALKIMLVKSANDLAYVIAEGIGGSIDGFSAMMNAEAARLGMHESHFVNPNGWDAAGHQSSARDLAILARALLRDFPDYEPYFGIGAVALGNKVYKNTNGLIGRYPGAIGMKTGFVCASGFNVVAVADRGGRRLIAVVMGATSGAERTIQAAQLLDNGFGNYSSNLGMPETLPASGSTSAPNICADLRRRGAPLADDTESGGPVAAHNPMFQPDSSNPAYAMFQTQSVGGDRNPMTTRSASGHVTLGPRAEFEPIPVYLGPAPGSTAPVLAARAPGVIPANALALAPTSQPAGTPAAPGQIAPSKSLAARPIPVQADADDAVGAPLTLTNVKAKAGAITPKAKGVAIKATAEPTSASLVGAGKKRKTEAKDAKAKTPVASAKLPKGALDGIDLNANDKAKPAKGAKKQKSDDQD